jgi:hypothetical protein
MDAGRSGGQQQTRTLANPSIVPAGVPPVSLPVNKELTRQKVSQSISLGKSHISPSFPTIDTLFDTLTPQEPAVRSASILAAAVAAISGTRCPYKSAVVLICAWPRTRDTSNSGVPSIKSNVAAECRKP